MSKASTDLAVTSFKPNNELLSRDGNPFWVIAPTLAHVKKLLFDTAYTQWMWNTVIVSVVSTIFSLFASVLAAYAIERLRFSGAKRVGLGIFLAYLVPPSILFNPLASVVFKLGLFDTRLALIRRVLRVGDDGFGAGVTCGRAPRAASHDPKHLGVILCGRPRASTLDSAPTHTRRARCTKP